MRPMVCPRVRLRYVLALRRLSHTASVSASIRHNDGLSRAVVHQQQQQQQQTKVQSVYAGRYKHMSSTDFYFRLTFKCDSRVQNRNVQLGNDCRVVVGRACARLQYVAGDVIEVRQRNGAVDLVVVDRELDKTTLVVHDHKQKEHIVRKKDVAFVLRGAISISPDKAKVADQFRMLVLKAYPLSWMMKEYWRLCYATKSRKMQLHAVSISELSRIAFQAAGKGRYKGTNQAVQLLAAYIGVSNESRYFNRLSNNSPLFALAETAAENARSFGQFGHPESSFLQHYAVFPDASYQAQLVEREMSKQYPERHDSKSWLTSPNTVLMHLDEAAHWNPLLRPGAPVWFDENGRLVDVIESILYHQTKQLLVTKDSAPRRGIKYPVYVLDNHMDIAFSVGANGRIEIHIPDIALMTANSKPFIDSMVHRNKTIRLGEDKKFVRGLLPKEFMHRMGFGSKHKKQCITVSVDTKGQNPKVELTTFSANNIVNASYSMTNSGWRFDASRTRDLEHLNTLRDVVAEFRDTRLQNKAIYDSPPSLALFQHRVNTPLEVLVREARLLAGQATATYAQTAQLPGIPYLTQSRHNDDNHENTDTFSALALQARTSMLAQHMCEHHYMGAELLDTVSAPHHGLGLTGYVDIAHPFDSVTSMHSSWRLRDALVHHRTRDDTEAAALTAHKLQLDTAQVNDMISAQSDMLDFHIDRVRRYDALRQLQLSLQRNTLYHVFRCTVLENARYPQLAAAYCEETNSMVDIALTPAATTVNVGDRVVCNEIVELSPVEGVLVLSI